MILKEIFIKNWKCFKEKHIKLLRWENGTGKTSLIESLIFLITDKRPSGLDFDSLRNNLEQNCELILKFEHNYSDYVIEREFGKASSYRLYKDNELISRTRADNKLIMEKIIPEVVINGLWGYNSLALSPVLKTDYLFEILDTEFSEPLALKKYFQTDRTFNQKNISSLEKTIKNQTVTQEDLDKLDQEIKNIEEKIKSKAFISDNEVIKAKQCESLYPKYIELSQQISQMEYIYDRDTCLRLFNQYKARNQKMWDDYFNNVEEQIQYEKSKASEVHPLAKYPKNIIDRMIKESEQSGKCIFCGDQYIPIHINYDLIDYNKIEQLEKILLDKKYNFRDLSKSIKYFQVKKQLEDLEYINNFNWREILDNYNKETNELYNKLEILKRQREDISSDLGKITDLLSYKLKYDEDKECMNIIDEYIASAKDYYANSITINATKILNNINPRYSRIFIENGIYKVLVNNEDYTNQSSLAVQSLSNGEKTIVALSLILTIRDLFMKNCPLVMDEAFVNLDANNIESVNEILRNDSSQWILVSHDERMRLDD